MKRVYVGRDLRGDAGRVRVALQPGSGVGGEVYGVRLGRWEGRWEARGRVWVCGGSDVPGEYEVRQCSLIGYQYR